MATTTSDLKEIWQAFHQRLRGFIAQRVHNPDDVDDILQEVFLKIYQQLTGVRNTERLGSWIFTIARNAIIDHYRKAYRHREFTTEDSLEPEFIAEDPAVFNQQMAACLHPLLAHLPETYREALQLVEFEGLTRAKVAEELGISLSGMKSRVQRGRQKLKDLLQTCCEIEIDAVGNAIDYEMKNISMCRSCGLAK